VWEYGGYGPVECFQKMQLVENLSATVAESYFHRITGKKIQSINILEGKWNKEKMEQERIERKIEREKEKRKNKLNKKKIMKKNNDEKKKRKSKQNAKETKKKHVRIMNKEKKEQKIE